MPKDRGKDNQVICFQLSAVNICTDHFTAHSNGPVQISQTEFKVS